MYDDESRHRTALESIDFEVREEGLLEIDIPERAIQVYESADEV